MWEWYLFLGFFLFVLFLFFSFFFLFLRFNFRLRLITFLFHWRRFWPSPRLRPGTTKIIFLLKADFCSEKKTRHIEFSNLFLLLDSSLFRFDVDRDLLFDLFRLLSLLSTLYFRIPSSLRISNNNHKNRGFWNLKMLIFISNTYH